MSDSYEKYLEVMHAEIDGEASNEQLVALREYLASNPKAQSVHAELVKLTEILSQIEEVETPGDLRRSILAALPPQRSDLGIGVRNNRLRLRIPLVRYAYALAAGLLLGAALTGVVFRNLSPLERSDVYGTLASRENISHYVVSEQMKLDDPGLVGSIELGRSGDNEMIVFDLNGEQPVDVEVGFDGSRAGLKGFSQQPNSVRSFEAKEGSISFRSEGKQRSTVILASEKHAQVLLNLRFYVGGKLVHQGTLGGVVAGGTPK